MIGSQVLVYSDVLRDGRTKPRAGQITDEGAAPGTWGVSFWGRFQYGEEIVGFRPNLPVFEGKPVGEKPGEYGVLCNVTPKVKGITNVRPFPPDEERRGGGKR